MVNFRQLATSVVLVSTQLSLVAFAGTAPILPRATSAPDMASTQQPGITSIQQTSSTRTAPATTTTVNVGNGDHSFKPDLIQALPGDTVEFRFGPTNHSVVRSEYEYPCIPYEMTGRGKTGFFSGFEVVDIILDDVSKQTSNEHRDTDYFQPPAWQIKINDTEPIFFYCSAPDSCNVWGMVGVINPSKDQSLARQRQMAKEAKFVMQPGEPFPAEASSDRKSVV